MNDQYLNGFITKCAEAGVDPDALIKQALSLSDALRFVPFLGGGLHGIADPTAGSSRLGTAFGEGLGGGIGGTLGGFAGGVFGDFLADNMPGHRRSKLQNIGALIGSSLGTALGTVPGRWMTKHDDTDSRTIQELKQEVEALKARRQAAPAGYPGINITMAQPPYPGPTPGGDGTGTLKSLAGLLSGVNVDKGMIT